MQKNISQIRVHKRRPIQSPINNLCSTGATNEKQIFFIKSKHSW